MKMTVIPAICVVAIVVTVIAFNPRTATARKAFKAEFDAMYVTPAAAPGFAKAVEAANCNICHAGDKKKDRNAYGQALAKLLSKDDVKNVPKIKASLESVEKEPSDPANPASQTFGELIKAGKLPGG
jgi:mono/diheme cytochrome c family protein